MHYQFVWGRPYGGGVIQDARQGVAGRGAWQEDRGGAAAAGQAEPEPDAPWWSVIALVLAMILAFAAYLLLFSELRFGATIFKTLMRAERLYIIVAGLGFVLLVIFYLIDFDCGVRGGNYLMFSFITTCMVFASVLCFRTLPHAPLMAFLVTSTAYFAAIYQSLFRGKITPAAYIRGLSTACFMVGSAAFIASCTWAGVNNCWWGSRCKTMFRDRLRVCFSMEVGPGSHCTRYGTLGVTCPAGCDEDADLSACPIGKPYCLAAFMLWASPFLMSAFALLLGVAMMFVAGSALEARSDARRQQQESERRFRVFFRAVLFLVLLLWLSASIAGAHMQVRVPLLTVTLAPWEEVVAGG